MCKMIQNKRQENFEYLGTRTTDSSKLTYIKSDAKLRLEFLPNFPERKLRDDIELGLYK